MPYLSIVPLACACSSSSLSGELHDAFTPPVRKLAGDHAFLLLSLMECAALILIGELGIRLRSNTWYREIG